MSAANALHSGQELTEIDPDLERIIDAWPTLPAGVKRDVLGLVEAAAEATE